MTRNRFPQALPAISFGILFLLVTTLTMTPLRCAQAQAQAQAQAREDAAEAATEQIYFDQLAFRQLPEVNIRKLLDEDRQAIKRLDGRTSPPVRIAVSAATAPFTLDDFTWHATESDYLGLLGLRSKYALAQALQIARFDMPEGTKLWIYDPQRKYPAGPYAPTKGRENPVVWTPAIAGEKLVVMIRSRERPRAGSDGLEIRTVMQTYQGVGGQVGKNGTEDACQQDLCVAENANQNNHVNPIPQLDIVGAATTVYTIQKTNPAPAATYACTGTLLNNLAGKNYILSSQHCIGNLVDPNNPRDALAQSITFYFDMKTKTADCSGNGHIGGPPSTIYPYLPASNATTVPAFWSLGQNGTDFMLLEPGSSSPVPSNYKFHRAGWDTNVNTLTSHVFGLHHPQGDVMAYSESSSAPQRVHENDFPTTPECDAATDTQCNFWHVTWKLSGVPNGGTGTEGGSSGSCLFDKSSGLCIGMLFGQGRGFTQTGCSPTLAPVSKSEYGMFGKSWWGPPGTQAANKQACTQITDGSKEKSLRCWLDPNNTLLNNSIPSMTGDTHICPANADCNADPNRQIHFQAVGEFVALREPGGFEVQTRQSAVGNSPHTDPTTGLDLCVSINTAVAARVGKHRVTYQMKSDTPPDPANPHLELRVDGILQDWDASAGKPLALEGGGLIVPQGGAGNIQIHFPDRHVLTVTATPWSNVWFLNVDLQRAATLSGSDGEDYSLRGIAGPVAAGEWLPDLPSGKHIKTTDRYQALYTEFADAWRVTPESSLFDYARGTSTDTYTLKSWPMPQNGQCLVPGQPQASVVEPTERPDPKAACAAVKGEAERSNCEFDVDVAGNAGVAKGYVNSQRIRTGGTVVTVQEIRPHRFGFLRAHFLATVRPSAPMARATPGGSVIFMVDGRDKSKPIGLDGQGQAKWSTWRFKARHHVISVRFIPSSKGGTDFLTSTSAGIGGPDRHH